MAAHLIYYASIDYISAETRSSAFMKVYLWSTNYDNATLTVYWRQGPRQGTKLTSGEIAYFSSYYYHYPCKIIYSTTADSSIQKLLYK